MKVQIKIMEKNEILSNEYMVSNIKLENAGNYTELWDEFVGVYNGFIVLNNYNRKYYNIKLSI